MGRWMGVVAVLVAAEVALAVPIVVKFRASSPSYAAWKQGGRVGAVQSLHAFVGLHRTEPLVSEALLQAVRQRAQRLGAGRAWRQVAELERLALVELPEAVDVALLLRKMQRHPELEYAEPLPERFLCGVPDDPMVVEQYALRLIRAFDAWDVLPAQLEPILVGIVDTGVDMAHPDLAGNIFLNPGEMGVDANGQDKRFNGVDDDGNGFIDDWRGWDFAAGDGRSYDNDPSPGNAHGTHVAGIVGALVNNGRGIAGVVPQVRLLVVKIGPDAPGSTQVVNSYEGILYAASMGAAVINCSWGGPSRSEAEHEIVRTAVALGAVIVAAAGNDGQRIPFYPAAYPEVLSVAATDSADLKAWYSNYHESISVAAPGDDILSTLPGGLYGRMSGTSMAAPIVSGVAALVRQRFREYTPAQVMARVMMTADNLDQRQPWLAGLLGWGRVNAYRALTADTVRACFIDSVAVSDADGDGFFDIGDTLRIMLWLRNVLEPLDSLAVEVFTPLVPAPEYVRRSVVVPSMGAGELRVLPQPLLLRIAAGIPDNAAMQLRFTLRYRGRAIGRGWATVVLRPVYRTLAANHIAVTFNSIGNIAFNDYPDNTQGDGFRWKESPNLLFEGALMVGISAERLSNVARGALQTQQDRSFVARRVLQLLTPGPHAALEAEAEFADEQRPGDLGVAVRQRIYQFSQPGWRDFVLVVYDVTNQTDSLFPNLHLGWYLDWDISPSATGDRALYDDSSGIGYVVCETCARPLPMAGALVVSAAPVNFYAIDNDAREMGVYDGFTRQEKWRALSSGLARRRSSLTDASMVIAAGPLRLEPGDTVRVVLALVAGMTLEELRQAASAARQAAATVGIDTVPWRPLPQSMAAGIYPNPWTPGQALPTLVIQLPERRYLRVRLVDGLGRFVGTLTEGPYQPGTYAIAVDPASLSSGSYFLYLTAGSEGMVIPVSILR